MTYQILLMTYNAFSYLFIFRHMYTPYSARSRQCSFPEQSLLYHTTVVTPVHMGVVWAHLVQCNCHGSQWVCVYSYFTWCDQVLCGTRFCCVRPGLGLIYSGVLAVCTPSADLAVCTQYY